MIEVVNTVGDTSEADHEAEAGDNNLSVHQPWNISDTAINQTRSHGKLVRRRRRKWQRRRSWQQASASKTQKEGKMVGNSEDMALHGRRWKVIDSRSSAKRQRL